MRAGLSLSQRRRPWQDLWNWRQFPRPRHLSKLPLRVQEHSSGLRILVVQSLSHIHLFATPWTAARQASLSFTISWNLLKFTSFESMMLSNISSSAGICSNSCPLSQWCCLTISSSAGICSNSCPLSQWCYLTISSSAVTFSSCPQSFPASRSFPMSQLFASDQAEF